MIDTYDSRAAGELYDQFKNMDLPARIRRHLTMTKADMASYASLCTKLDQAFAPTSRLQNGVWDVHPENRVIGQAHVSIPLVYSTVLIKSNLIGLRPPKFNLRPLDRKDDKSRADAEFIETIIDKIWSDEEMNEVHLNFARCLSLYGRGVIQDGPDFTHNVDQQYNVWISWRRLGEPEAMSFAELISPAEAIEMGWDGTTFNESMRFDFPIYGGMPHDDPIGAKERNWGSSTNKVLVNGKVPVLHFYHQEKKNGTVRYSLVVNGQIIKAAKSTGRKTWPFTMIETEHIPGLPNGVGDAEPVLEFQYELSERLSAWAEAVRRTIKDQWKAWGLRQITPRMLPGGGQVWEFSDKEEEDIEPLKFINNTVDIVEYMKAMLEEYRRVSGIPSESQGQSLSHTSGYLANIKYQSLITNLGPRKVRMARAYKQWALNKLDSIKKQYPKYAYLIEDAKYVMEVDWEEITPSDMQAEITRVSQAVTMKIMSPYTAMEETGLVPEDEIRMMEEFWTNPKLNPQGAMAAAQAALMMQQVQNQAQNAGNVAQAQGAQAGGFDPSQFAAQGLNQAIAGRTMPNNPNPATTPQHAVTGANSIVSRSA